MNKTKTAVEWLEQEFIALQNYGINELGLFSKAKAMEKEQVMNAYGQGIADEAGEILDATKDAEEYYQKTYGEDQDRS
jgi:hypothetical protein